jgi:nucleoside-diphosphate-sugar epimerase
MSFDPEIIAAEIRKHLPGFTMDYRVDPVKQCIADSWPNRMDDSCAREEWGWAPRYDLGGMTEDMLRVIHQKD